MAKLKLLYVDDEKANLTNFEIAFKRQYQILTAGSGQEALRVFEDNDDIAIVVADQRMPGMTGVELLHIIKQRNEDVIRIILTAYTEVSDIIDSINKGSIYQYIVKPWDGKDLLQLLKKAGEKYLLICENKRLVKKLEEDISKRKRLEGILVRRDMALAEVTDMAVNLLLNSNWQEYAEELIARLGTVMAVSKIHIFQHRNDEHGDLVAEQKFEWVAEHITILPDEPALHNFSYKQLKIERWITSFTKGELISGNCVDFPENEATWLSTYEIKSIVGSPILTDENCWGFIAFEDCNVEREWARPELDALRTAATLLGTAISRQKMESNIAHQQAQLAHAGRLTALGEMASGIGHEIHQPLSVINLNAENCQSYLAKHDPHSLAAEAADDIVGQVKKITRLIDNMRRYSRLSSGHLTNINLLKPLNNALTFYKEQFRVNNIGLEIKANNNIPLTKGDTQKFEQILVNFLSNARHAVDARQDIEPGLQKKVWIVLDYKNISNEELANLSFIKEKNTSNQVILFEVKDNGIGMDDDTQKRCLEPFFTTKAVGDGTGLGLSVSYGIIKELNFHLEVESQLGKGTTFRLYMPVEQEKQL